MKGNDVGVMKWFLAAHNPTKGSQVSPAVLGDHRRTGGKLMFDRGLAGTAMM